MVSFRCIGKPKTFRDMHNSKTCDDVFTENLDYFLEDKNLKIKRYCVLKFKRFGGNNATSALISKDLTLDLINKI